MALDTIPKQEGGKFKAVASGTLPSGQPVVVNSDGTVSVVEGSSATQAIGTATVFESATVNYTGVAFDSSNNKIVIAYQDSGNAGYGTAVVGTVTGTSISFGTPVVFNSADSRWNAITFDSNSNKVVIAYDDRGNSSYGTAIVGTVSGTSISFGSEAVFESAGTARYRLTYDTNAQKVVIAYGAGAGKVVVGDVSGTSISFGSPTTYVASTTSYSAITYDTTSQKVVLAWQDESASNQGRAAVGTVSGTSISLGTTATFSTDDSRALNLVYDAASGKVVVCFRNASSTDDGVAVVGTVSGTSISFGSVVTFDSSTIANLTASYDTNAQKVIAAYRDSSTDKGNFAVGTVDGTAITFATPVEFLGNSLAWTSSTFDANAEKVIVAYKDQGNSSYGSATAIQVAYENTNLTSENYIGMSGGVVSSETVTQALGSVVDITTASPEYYALAFDEDAGKVVVAYKEGSGTQYGLCAVGTVSGTSITFGTPVAYTNFALSSRSQGIAFDSSTNKVVISYCRGSDNHGQAIVGTVSGNSISFGSATTFNAGTTLWVSSVFDSSNSKVVVVYSDQGNSEYGTAIVGTVSGTSISFGTEVVFESAQSEYIGSTFDSTNNKVVAVYRDAGNSGKGTAIVGTVSGTSISFGTAAIFNDASTFWADAAFDSTNGKAVVIYMDDGNSQYGTAVVGTVSGTDITFGSEVVFSTAATTAPVAAFDSGVGKVTVAYRDAGNSNNTTIVPATVSGTSISFDTAVDVGIVNGGGESIGIVFDSTNNKIVTTFKDNSVNDNSAVVFQNAGTIVTRAEVADGDAATVDIVGSVSSNQVSLTAGQKYYVQTDGTIGETPADPSVLAGTAISATKMVVKS